jgi:large subunit ribosomal protein L10
LAITRERKEELVDIYNQLLQGTTGFVVTEYRGLSVHQVDALRAKLRESGGSYLITKNTLFKIALEQAGWVVPDELLAGPVATAFANGDMPAMIKSVLDYQKDHPDFFVIKGGVMGESVLTVEELKAISELPPLDELRSQLLGLLDQPATGLVSVLNQPATDIVNIFNAATTDLLNVLQAYVQQQEGGEAA